MSLGPCVVTDCTIRLPPHGIFCAAHWHDLAIAERRELCFAQYEIGTALARGEQADFDRARLRFEGIVAVLIARLADRRPAAISPQPTTEIIHAAP